MVDRSDQAIVDQVRMGDVEAFGVLVDKYQDRIYSAIRNYVSNPDDAVDIAQDAFVKAYSKLGSFDASSAFYTWFYRIAINTAIDYLRKRKSRPTDSLEDEKFTAVGYEPISTDLRADPLSVATVSEQKAVLRSAIDRLSRKLKPVLVLHDIEGLSQDEVAEILQIPVGTVKSRISRARSELRELLKGQLVDIL